MIVRISAYDLIVEIHADLKYPDALSDVVNRANESFAQAVESLAKNRIPVGEADEDDYEPEDEDDDKLPKEDFDL
jgi:hypothetical protein